MKTSFILASKSPQRREILQNLGVSFGLIPSDFDEKLITERDPIERAKKLAEAKAKEVAEKYPDHRVIAVDTLVVSSCGELLEKPFDADDARRMLKAQSGKTSAVHSGICLVRERGNKSISPNQAVGISTAYVAFRDLTDEALKQWIKTGLWEERSGAFQIELPNVRSAQEIENHPLIQKLEGEFETVVGFPVGAFEEMCQIIAP